MALCDWCDQEMLTADDCTGNVAVAFPDGTTAPSVPYQPEAPAPGRRCRDCGVLVGSRHHPGCDTERCPRCGHQLISCGCLDDEDAS